MNLPPLPIRLETFRHLFAWIAEEMGATLVRSARSVNIKERRDCSCALFDNQGRMVAQAEHIPVHLGSMPMSVLAALDAFPKMNPGDVVLLNDPYRGGTHLPNITAVRPVFLHDHSRFVVAARAHFSDIGGSTPGSMPLSTDLFQEGLVVPPVRLVQRGEMQEDLLSLFLANLRNPGQARGDLLALLASLSRGERRLKELEARYGTDALKERAEELVGHGERMMRAALRALPEGTYRFEDSLDDDGLTASTVRICVTLTLANGEAVVDFTGSAPETQGNVNAVEAVTLSAVLYCFRCLLPPDAPTNAGNLAPIRVIAPLGTVVNARRPHAVAAGNVETSQRIVDVLFGALAQAAPTQIPAASAGTMNNISFGNASFGYYETVGGGMGGRPDRPGVNAVQTHMTNTRNTPIESLEHNYPLRVVKYSIRRGSGGDGTHKGGEGIIREFEFLEPVEVSVISDRRKTRPYGLAGGKPGAAGRNFIQGREMPGKFTARLNPGDRLRVETPGGGGFGSPRGSLPNSTWE